MDRSIPANPDRPLPELCAPAALIADRARASMLLALEQSGELSATELARGAAISRATASEHLSRLVEGGLVLSQRRSRVRFYRLAGPHVAKVLHALDSLAHPMGPIRQSRQILDQPDRLARTCYDHLAGRLGVAILDGLMRARYLSTEDGATYGVRVPGAKFLRDFGVDLRQPATHRRPLGRACVDRTERRPHLAGHVGAQLAARLMELRWIAPVPGTRALRVTPAGRRGLRDTFGVEV